MTEFEGQVIENAINFVFQMRHGLFSANAKSREDLDQSVDSLLAETDGEWAFYSDPDHDETEKGHGHG
ncbi:hypothetical protein LCGC14_1800310 [marine sediment metagenome]|uniref:Uncharacterized protein n=1 Tax=marine sediment metagenome TaxID=412755 RepID=A0A0F9GPZ3_9ZZZZ